MSIFCRKNFIIIVAIRFTDQKRLKIRFFLNFHLKFEYKTIQSLVYFRFFTYLTIEPMIDIKKIRDDVAAYKLICQKRNMNIDVD